MIIPHIKTINESKTTYNDIKHVKIGMTLLLTAFGVVGYFGIKKHSHKASKTFKKNSTSQLKQPDH